MENKKTAELHVHLEGCLWNRHFSKWRGSKVDWFPPINIDASKRPLSFEEFLSIIRFGYNFLNGETQYLSVLIDYLDYMEHQNIVYTEMQINSVLLKTFRIDIKELLSKFNKEIGKRKKRTIKFIIDLPWQFSASNFENIINDFEQYQELGVVGLSMGGDETLAKPMEVASVFRRAKHAGYKILCHAGETTSLEFAKNIVEELQPDRIGHGISLSDWFLHRKDRTIIDTCLTSNFKLGIIKEIRDHPFGRWLQNDHIIATLSTDDPAIFDTTLKKEYELARENFEFFNNYTENKNTLLVSAAFDKEAISNALF